MECLPLSPSESQREIEGPVGERCAEFRLSDSQIDDVREKLKTMSKYQPIFVVEVNDEAGIVIAEVEKMLHVRKKESVEPSGR